MHTCIITMPPRKKAILKRAVISEEEGKALWPIFYELMFVWGL